MGDTMERVEIGVLVAEAHRLVDALQGLELTLHDDDEVVTALRSLESVRRRLETVDHALILDAERRGLPTKACARSTGQWLRTVLTVDISEANARVRGAQAAGSRRSLLGEVLPPAYPSVAAAQADGSMSAKQARLITFMLERLPDAEVEHVPAAEARLVGFARVFEPHALKQLVDHERDWLDPDGKYSDVERRRRDRDVQLHVRPDGSVHGSFAGTAELGEFLQTTFDALAAPAPAADGVRDPRSAGQRRHDALLQALKITVGSGSLPSTGGVLATVVLTMTVQDYATGEGFATTGHGAQVPTTEAMSWAGGDYRLMCTVLNSLKAVVAYSSTHRLFTEGQRLALIARDRGCSFPGCLAPPGWCQTHHIREWQHDGPTSTSNGTLLCGHHHREFHRTGWTVTLTDGRPTWTPPPSIDPTQTPISS